MIAFQISPEVESLYGLGRQATKFEEFVWNFATLQGSHLNNFSAENSQT